MQTLSQLLPSTEDGLHNTVQSSTKLTLIIVSAWMVILGIGGQVVAHHLDKATANQCLNHDWLKEADQVHRDWCIGNGYKLN